MSKKENITNPTPEQIEAWKKQFGDLFQLEIGCKTAILRKPDRRVLSMATAMSVNDPIKFNEIILDNCWLAGDEEIKTNDDYFIPASGKLSELMSYKTAELKKI